MKFTKIDIGVRYMLFASLMFALVGAFAKLSSEHMSSLEVVFFRNIFGVILIGATVLKSPMKHIGGKPLLLIFRGVIGFLALLAFFYNIAHISLGEAMTFSKTSPIFTTIFAWIFLHERLSYKGWLAVFIGFIGMLFITQITDVEFSIYDVLGLFSGAGAGLAYTSVRELKKYYDTRAIVLSFMSIGTVGPIILFFISPYLHVGALNFILGKFIMPHGVVWFYILALGIFATLAQVYMTKAYGASQAAIVGVVGYANIPFSIAVGLFLGDSLPNISMTIGICLIILAGVLVIPIPIKNQTFK